eukprot:scpid23619/ scgid28577/ Uncharacterized protein K02A2.6
MAFHVITDHKPLLQIFAPTYPLSQASLRVQRLLFKIQDMIFTVSYRPGQENLVADALSRLPVEEADVNFAVVQHITMADGLSTDHRQRIAEPTAADATLCAVRDALRTDNWPSTSAVAPYRALRHELSVWPYPGTQDFVILRQERLVIPEAAVPEVLKPAHDGHPGVRKTKARLRESVWWPGWAEHVKQHLKKCEPCLKETATAPVPLKPRELPPRPWHTIAIDLFYYQN